MNANQIELHYFLPERVHSANAFSISRAEMEFLHIIKETAAVLEIEFSLEARALEEGGLKQLWKAFGKNANQIGVLLSVVAIAISLKPASDSELVELQKEEAKLHIQLLKSQLKEGQIGTDTKKIRGAAKEVSNNLKIVRRKSNFFQAALSEPKISSVSFSLFSDGSTIDEPINIKREDFQDFIALTGELPSEVNENAVIGIISPVLKKGKYKWKGEYNGDYIEFWLQDKKFKESVLKKEIEFHSGTAICGVLESKIKVDEVGEISTAGHYVKVVKKVLDEDYEFTTPSGQKFEFEKEADENQFKLF